jgi:hypothetical protein
VEAHVVERRPKAAFLLVFALRTTLSSISLWIPALILLLPTLVLQLAVPNYLRTRLSPSPGWVIAGSLALLFLTQIVMPSIFAIVHARRTGQSAPSLLPSLRASIRAGTRSFLGLVLGVIPGIWLQARYAFAAIPTGCPGDGLAWSAERTRGRLGRLMFCGLVAMVASGVAQSLVAVLNDVLGVVTATGSANGRTTFALRYGPHVVTTLLAYVCSAGAATLHAVAVSAIHDEADLESRATPPDFKGHRPAAPATMRRFAIGTSVALFVGLAAVIYKIHQHLF